MNTLPPLNALRTFVVVADKGTFKLAAEELCVTQSAVGQQIKNLESYLGFKLFERQSKGLLLTNRGARLRPAVSKAFALIVNEVNELDRPKNEIDVRTSASFASSWLMPRLQSFEQRHLEVSVILRAGARETFQNDQSTYGIEVVYDESADSKVGDILLEEWLWPVCSPSLLDGKRIAPESLEEHRLLLNSPGGRDWRLWADQIGLPNLANYRLKKSMQLPTDSAAIDMASSGYGIALANLHYAQHQLESGLLVAATEIPPYRLGAHYLVSDERCRNRADELFVTWLKNAAVESTTAAAHATMLT